MKNASPIAALVWGLITLAISVWSIYFILSVADYINCYPFNGGWPF